MDMAMAATVLRAVSHSLPLKCRAGSFNHIACRHLFLWPIPLSLARLCLPSLPTVCLLYIGGTSLLTGTVSVGTVYALIRYTAVVEQGYTALSEGVARFFASYGEGQWPLWRQAPGSGGGAERGALHCAGGWCRSRVHHMGYLWCPTPLQACNSSPCQNASDTSTHACSPTHPPHLPTRPTHPPTCREPGARDRPAAEGAAHQPRQASRPRISGKRGRGSRAAVPDSSGRGARRRQQQRQQLAQLDTAADGRELGGWGAVSGCDVWLQVSGGPGPPSPTPPSATACLSGCSAPCLRPPACLPACLPAARPPSCPSTRLPACPAGQDLATRASGHPGPERVVMYV